MSALWFLVQMTPEEPAGEQRPSPLSDDPDERKEQLDVDGEMPGWMAEAIVKALIDTFEDHPHPKIYQGDAFQQQIDQGFLTNVIRDVTGHGLDRPFQELLDGIAPPPSFSVPKGFPLPWEVQTAYRFMITMYKLNFSGSWELEKPRVPDFVIVPPVSDVTNLFQPPDFSGVNGDNPIEDVCDVFIALVEWIVKEIAAAIKLAGDIIKMLVSPNTYAIRLALYELAMRIWDVAMKTHDVMAHTGILLPHGEQRYENGELRLPNEIDLPLITLGGTVDGAFLQALADAIDPLGNLDQNQGVIVSHSVRDPRLPFYPVLQYHANGHRADDWEYHRPWAYPETSEFEDNGQNSEIPTPTETYDPSKPDDQAPADDPAPAGPFKPMRPGPYPEGTTPDQVFFRTDAGVDAEGRGEYESSQSPWQTDLLNERFIGKVREMKSPLGDPVPFSAYLIGRLVNPTDYQTQFNLDADRAFAYLTWDWIRGEQIGTAGMGIKYQRPVVPPENDDGTFHESGEPDFSAWDNGVSAMQLKYVDPPPPPVIILLRPGEGDDAAATHLGGEDERPAGDDGKGAAP
jgi:hypothetical protein